MRHLPHALFALALVLTTPALAQAPAPPAPAKGPLSLAKGTRLRVDAFEAECEESFTCETATPDDGQVCTVIELERISVDSRWFGQLSCDGVEMDVTNDDVFRFTLLDASAPPAPYVKAVEDALWRVFTAQTALHVALEKGPAEAELAAFTKALAEARKALEALPAFAGDDSPRAAGLTRLALLERLAQDAYRRESALIKAKAPKAKILAVSTERHEAGLPGHANFVRACNTFRKAHGLPLP